MVLALERKTSVQLQQLQDLSGRRIVLQFRMQINEGRSEDCGEGKVSGSSGRAIRPRHPHSKLDLTAL
ncbi:hypothetical protein G9P44_006250 [Scheffersomyces stipitis]|nr:hypothetical protein G9P44_006250 [Scheffersomyces stipitis]